jgi:hypothetical protein
MTRWLMRTVDCTLYWRRVVRFYQGYIVKYILAVFFESRASTILLCLITGPPDTRL